MPILWVRFCFLFFVFWVLLVLYKGAIRRTTVLVPPAQELSSPISVSLLWLISEPKGLWGFLIGTQLRPDALSAATQKPGVMNGGWQKGLSLSEAGWSRARGKKAKGGEREEEGKKGASILPQKLKIRSCICILPYFSGVFLIQLASSDAAFGRR